jgi:ABC-2 type transport system ATP-binding protein
MESGGSYNVREHGLGGGGGTMKDREEGGYWGERAQDFNENQTQIVGEETQRDIHRWLSGERELGETLEFGCGGGYFTQAIAENASHVVATDISDEMLVEARKLLGGLGNVTLERADCMGTAYPSDRFDTVLMANLIHILEVPSPAIEESHRVLRDGGLLLVVDYTMHGMKWFHIPGMGMRFLRRWGKPPSYARGDLTPEDLRSMVEAAGFEVETVEVLGDRSKAIVLRARKR